MQYLKHIEKCGSDCGQYVASAGGKVWTIHPCSSVYGKWRAFNQHAAAEDFYAWTLTAMDAIFQTIHKNPPFQTILKPDEFAISKARHMRSPASDMAAVTVDCMDGDLLGSQQPKLPVVLCLALGH